ncbi:hypothetical protein HZ99_03485 [Pseudomonas fluorescens]|nr:hypothetical protein HZ99_03485 [Pseudomonas fluorescens]
MEQRQQIVFIRCLTAGFADVFHQKLSGNDECFEASSLENAPLHTPLTGRRRWLEILITDNHKI